MVGGWWVDGGWMVGGWWVDGECMVCRWWVDGGVFEKGFREWVNGGVFEGDFGMLEDGERILAVLRRRVVGE